jgi:hypothetical protein
MQFGTLEIEKNIEEVLSLVIRLFFYLIMHYLLLFGYGKDKGILDDLPSFRGGN